nr:bromodomain-containing protein 1-like isoform X2 [Paramormyrops kingsleyae]
MKRKAKLQRTPVSRRAASPIKPSPNRETLTYAQAQRMVELEIDGRVHRISIFDKLEIISDDDATAQEIVECNSNKENSEKPQQALVRSVRLKNSQQKKSAALTASPGTQAPGGTLKEPKIRTVEYNLPVVPRRPPTYYTYVEKTPEELDEEVEYDMDEEDFAWLDLVNEKRRGEGFSPVSHNVFEFLMDRLEKESFLESHGHGEPLIDEDAVCCICMDGECQNSNVILFCDMCNMAVHQECYGVPYVPEGQWLCRLCMQSPSQPVDCILCPNKGGALKKTDDDRWGHVVCALWVPEVGFSDTVFIEPIDGVKNIPPARWKLTCYLCKEKGVGACIQCHRANCYMAFHVSCAQKAGLYMKMEPVKGAESDGGTATFTVKKTAYCEAHTPSGCVRRPLTIYEDCKTKNGLCRESRMAGSVRLKGTQKKKKTKKSPPKPTAAVPALSVPSISPQRLNTILNQVSIQKKKVFVERVLSYWMLKRQSRNGLPLLRRLLSGPQAQKAVQPRETERGNQVLKEQLKDWHRLRHDLERARLLLELIRKREKLKREEIRLQQTALEVQLTPFAILLRSVLDQLQEKDPTKIFTQPVSIKEVPDYLDHIKHPMDFSTMRKRINAQGYRSLEEFEADFNLIVSNCMKYNAKDTIFYRAAVRLRDQGGAVLRKTRRHAERVGFDYASGLHLPEPPKVELQAAFSWDDVDRLLSPVTREHMSLNEQLKELLEMLDLTRSIKSCPSRSRRLKLLKKTIADVRNEISLRETSEPAGVEPDPAGRAVEDDGDKSQPPKLEPSDSLPPPNSDGDSEPPTLRPVDPNPDGRGQRHVKFGARNCDGPTPGEVLNGHPPDPVLPDGNVGTASAPSPAEPPCTVNRRTSVLFRKSKSMSPQKSAKAGDGQQGAPQLGTKTFLSVVLPRLETLLQPRKRTRSASGDSEAEDPSPVKRFDAAQSHACQTADALLSRLQGCLTALSSTRRGCRCPAGSWTVDAGVPLSPASPLAAVCHVAPVSLSSQSAARTNLRSCGGTQWTTTGSQWAAARVAAGVRPPRRLLIIDPKMARGGCNHNGVSIPTPPLDVLRAGERMQYRSEEKLFLVLFFDNRRSWQWLPKSKMAPLGVDKTTDMVKLMEGRTSSIRKAVQKAFGRATGGVLPTG